MSVFKPYDKRSDISFTMGVYPTYELLIRLPGKTLEIAYTRDGLRNKGLVDILAIAKKAGVHTFENAQLVGKIAKREGAYVVAAFKKDLPRLEPGTNHVVLVNPSDMGNLGTTIRTMASFGINNLAIIKPSADVFDPKTVRASMGSLFQMRFDYFSSYADYRTKFHNHLYTFVTGSQDMLAATNFVSPYALVFGNEGSGLDKDISKHGQPVSIEQTTSTDSLNVTVTVGIVLHTVYTKTAPTR
ncbi:TPA: TrmH family RNA methyltransferase [candidate division WWE3 bacterium]|uniref:tRNA/rRNA methyltransferase SpoU type domain-containing protein n=2 Tax=Katanobacteria TaxID=422282 RepID=A0A1F4V6S5_UNCKA|nr:MAG: hypothetical protein A2709_00335 [candidate division WWE3 bacterium RIFCSPHIGHO2_01_FULL_43_9]HAZ29768.1 TrmH family RNA methyltransferase [candidate division WWE3 bacterium]